VKRENTEFFNKNLAGYDKGRRLFAGCNPALFHGAVDSCISTQILKTPKKKEKSTKRDSVAIGRETAITLNER
jgi:hypothetical protein